MVLNTKLLKKGYRYFKLRTAFPKFCCRHSALVEKYNITENISAKRYI